MKFKVLFVLIGIAILVGSGFFYLRYITGNPYQDFSYEEFHNTRPQKRLVNITGCKFDLLSCVFYESKYSDTVKSVYIPIKATTSESDSIYLIYKSRNKKLKRHLQAYKNKKASSNKNDHDQLAEILYFITSNDYDKPRSVNGLLFKGTSLEEKELSDLRKKMDNLDSDFVILKPIQENHLYITLFLLIFLGLCTIIFPFFYVNNKMSIWGDLSKLAYKSADMVDAHYRKKFGGWLKKSQKETPSYNNPLNFQWNAINDPRFTHFENRALKISFVSAGERQDGTDCFCRVYDKVRNRDYYFTDRFYKRHNLGVVCTYDCQSVLVENTLGLFAFNLVDGSVRKCFAESFDTVQEVSLTETIEMPHGVTYYLSNFKTTFEYRCDIYERYS